MYQERIMIVLVKIGQRAHTLSRYKEGLNTVVDRRPSTKWKESRVGRVTASRFGDVLLRRSPPTASFINTFLILASIQLFQLPLIMAFRMK